MTGRGVMTPRPQVGRGVVASIRRHGRSPTRRCRTPTLRSEAIACGGEPETRPEAIFSADLQHRVVQHPPVLVIRGPRDSRRARSLPASTYFNTALPDSSRRPLTEQALLWRSLQAARHFGARVEAPPTSH